MKSHVLVFLSGLVFSVGLGVSGMTQPAKIIAFLDITGHWDPTLLSVMCGAVVPMVFAWRFVRGRAKPLMDAEFGFPLRGRVDSKLLAGSAIFGAGWGLGGYCPGPAVTAFTTLQAQPAVLVAGMLVGMIAVEWLWPRIKARNAPIPPSQRGQNIHRRVDG
jgi:uncharacterized membrane protein YedE/YeeE